jgi:pilus assembly protein CpaE
MTAQRERNAMRIGRAITPDAIVPGPEARVVVLTADPAFEDSVRSIFGAGVQIGLDVIAGRLAERGDDIGVDQSTVIVADIDVENDAELQALERLVARLGNWPPLVAVTSTFDAAVARRLMQMRIADFLVKPVPPVELMRACVRVAEASRSAAARDMPAGSAATEAQIFTFLPAVGGAGVTTLAVQTAMLLLNSGARGKASTNKTWNNKTSTCLVDLDFQHGTCADYLDIEPRLNLSEIEPRPERLDRQLLEVMLTQHASGLAVIAAPNRPAEMRSFDPDVVTRLLDLVSSHFDYVVIDMPRTWFSWTDSVLLGSNRLFIVSETTVPSLRHARQLVDAIRERLGDTPKPQVIINRFVQKFLSPGLRRSDIEQAIGDAFLACVPNDYALVREAIDRGVPLDDVKKGNKITLELKKLILPQAGARPAREVASGARKFMVSWARS